MNMVGQQALPCSCEVAWAALFSPAILKQCIPGCEEIELTSDSVFRTRLALKIGPVSARFNGTLAVVDQRPPYHTKLQFEGQGGVAGFGKGEATIELSPDGTGCVLNYSADAHVGGRLAQIGSRLVDATAERLSDQFFSRFIAHLSSLSEASTVSTALAGGVAPINVPAEESFIAWNYSTWTFVVKFALAAALFVILSALTILMI